MAVAEILEPVNSRDLPAAATSAGKRFEGIDRMRGLVMVIMALDHVRDFVHYDSVFMDPADPDKTNLALFLTRFGTHYCAPTFVLLAGMSAAILGDRLRDPARLAGFLLSRGVWLMLIELTVVSFAWAFAPRSWWCARSMAMAIRTTGPSGLRRSGLLSIFFA